MIEKLETSKEPYGDWAIREESPNNFQLMEKINEIIDYLNEQEKNNSCRVNWTHQDSITGKNTSIEELLED